MTPEEQDLAACAPVDKAVFFENLENPVKGTAQHTAALEEAKKYCDGCPVRKVCLVGQLKVPFGFAGGYTDDARGFLRLAEPRWDTRR